MRPLWPALVLSAALTVGCSADPEPAVSAEPTAGPPPLGTGLEVVAAVYPLAWIAREVAPQAEVELLNEGGQDAHDLDLTPLQRAAVESADVMLYVGDLDYQPQVEEAAGSAEGEVVDASAAAGEAALIPASESGDAHGPEDLQDDEELESPSPSPSAVTDPSPTTEPSGGPEESEGDGEEGTGPIDPHLWFSPSIMARVAVATGEAFADADPDNARAYQTSAARVRDDLMALGEEVEEILGGDCLFDEAVVSHAAYGYLLEPFGKRQHSLTAVGAEGDPSAGELAVVVEEVREQGFRYVLTEPVEGRAAAEAVAGEAKVELLEVLPLDAVSEDQAGRGLPALVRAQARRFGIAMGCTG
jgi:zinc transport system substrate-binding protein